MFTPSSSLSTLFIRCCYIFFSQDKSSNNVYQIFPYDPSSLLNVSTIYLGRDTTVRSSKQITGFTEGPLGACSPWHDIPLYADKENNILNMVVEIPRWTNAKMEVC